MLRYLHVTLTGYETLVMCLQVAVCVGCVYRFKGALSTAEDHDNRLKALGKGSKRTLAKIFINFHVFISV